MLLQEHVMLSRVAATVSGDQVQNAVLHADLLQRRQHLGLSLGKQVLLQPMASLAGAAVGRFYWPYAYYSWVFGILQHYDMPDVVAALAPGSSVLVVDPLDELFWPLPQDEAAAVYKFAQEQFHAHGSTFTLWTSDGGKADDDDDNVPGGSAYHPHARFAAIIKWISS